MTKKNASNKRTGYYDNVHAVCTACASFNTGDMHCNIFRKTLEYIGVNINRPGFCSRYQPRPVIWGSGKNKLELRHGSKENSQEKFIR